jgi:hypothetical protein
LEKRPKAFSYITQGVFKEKKMANCENCGNELQAGMKFCTSCGAAVSASPVKKETRQTEPAVIVQPVQQTAAEPTGQYAVISTLGWIGYFIVTAIPIVGIVMCFVWAFTDGNLNRRNYFRAALIMMAVFIVLGIIFSAVITMFIGSLSSLLY